MTTDRAIARRFRRIAPAGHRASALLAHRPLAEIFERVLDLLFEAVAAERAAILLTNASGEVEITAFVPTSEVLRYAIDLRSLTGGRGRFSLEHSHYDPVPSHLAEKIRKEHETEK